MPTFGPGELQIGETGTEIDASCLVNSFTIEVSKDQADETTKLCGNVKPGTITYTYSATGNLDLDTDLGADGLFALSQANPGAQLPFTYTPNTEDGTTASGVLILDPMNFGGDEYGTDMNSDVEWALVGQPTYTYGTDDDPPVEVDRFAPRVRNGRQAPITVAKAYKPAQVAKTPEKAPQQPESVPA